MLLGDCMIGLVFYTASNDPAPVDFVLTGVGRIFVAHNGWWLMDDWGLNVGTAVYDGTLVQDEQGWKVTGRADGQTGHFGPPDLPSDPMRQAIAEMRDNIDAQRPAYLRQLQFMLDWLEPAHEFDLSPWIDMMLARPKRDPVLERLREMQQERPVGQVFVENWDGETIDVLVFDGYGAAASAQGVPQVVTLAESWRSNAIHPPLEEYANWLMEHPPYGVSVVRPSIRQASGSAEEIAGLALAITA